MMDESEYSNGGKRFGLNGALRKALEQTPSLAVVIAFLLFMHLQMERIDEMVLELQQIIKDNTRMLGVVSSALNHVGLKINGQNIIDFLK